MVRIVVETAYMWIWTADARRHEKISRLVQCIAIDLDSILALMVRNNESMVVSTTIDVILPRQYRTVVLVDTVEELVLPVTSMVV